MKIDISGQVALVTGAAHRVGKAIAIELAREGCSIVLHYGHSGDATVDQAREEIEAFGVEAFPVQADLSQPQGVEALFQAVRDHYGRLDILVNSASNFQRRTLMDITLDDWDTTMAINLRAPFLCTQQAVPLMRAGDPPGGAIVNICDRGSLEPWPDYAHHGISKAGLLALSQVSAVSLGPDIRVNSIIPGLVMKPEARRQEDWETGALKTPVQRSGTSEDVARAVVYLCTEDFLTGVVLRVDGGAYLM